MNGVTQAHEPTSYIVEGNSYRQLIAERDAYKRIANDLARQLREIKPADTNVPSERVSAETPAPRRSDLWDDPDTYGPSG